MRQNSEKSSKVKNQDREYLDQTDLHSSLDQEMFNEELSSLTETKSKMIAQRFKKRINASGSSQERRT